jgi:hypothetical protein
LGFAATLSLTLSHKWEREKTQAQARGAKGAFGTGLLPLPLVGEGWGEGALMAALFNPIYKLTP